MALSREKIIIVASTSNSAAGTTRGRVDLTSLSGDVYGGIVTLKITNGATAPALQCEGRVLISHEVVLPAAASAGADWKTVWRFGGGTTSNGVTEQAWTFGPEVRHIEIEFTGNTTQAVTVEAIATAFMM